MSQHKQETDDQDEYPYDPRDYNDGPLSEEDKKALWTDPAEFKAACEELFERFKAFVGIQQ